MKKINRTNSWEIMAGQEVALEYPYPATSNRATTRIGATAQNYVYDAAGNMTSDPSKGLTMAYGADGKMSQATKGGVTTTYATNGLGQRVKKSNASGTTTGSCWANTTRPAPLCRKRFISKASLSGSPKTGSFIS